MTELEMQRVIVQLTSLALSDLRQLHRATNDTCPWFGRTSRAINVRTRDPLISGYMQEYALADPALYKHADVLLRNRSLNIRPLYLTAVIADMCGYPREQTLEFRRVAKHEDAFLVASLAVPFLLSLNKAPEAITAGDRFLHEDLLYHVMMRLPTWAGKEYLIDLLYMLRLQHLADTLYFNSLEAQQPNAHINEETRSVMNTLYLKPKARTGLN